MVNLIAWLIVGEIVGVSAAGIVLPLWSAGTINQSHFNFPALLMSLGDTLSLLTIFSLCRRRSLKRHEDRKRAELERETKPEDVLAEIRRLQ